MDDPPREHPRPGRESLKHFRSPIGLYDVHAIDIARCCLRPINYAVWDCGTGKTILGMATAAMLFEDGLIDCCVVVAERSKVDADEWPKDSRRSPTSMSSPTTAPRNETKIRERFYSMFPAAGA